MMFKDKPADFNKKFDVVGCFVEHDGKFLMLHRLARKPNGDTWGLPAGKVDPGEDARQAVVREVREESGIDLAFSDFKLFDSWYVRHLDFDFDWHMFAANFATKPEVTISPDEHAGYMWVSPEEALAMNLITDLPECIESFYGRKR